jgi:hypothetical protein
MGIPDGLPSFSVEFEMTGQSDNIENYDEPVPFNLCGWCSPDNPCQSCTEFYEYRVQVMKNAWAGNHSDYMLGVFEMIERGFLRAVDGSVSDELKSPIYHDWESFQGHLPLLDRMSRYVGRDCGTHIHVHMRAREKSVLIDHYESILGPMVKRMRENLFENEVFWGREDSEYAVLASTITDRCVWLNPRTDYDTIEFRLPKYRDSRQFSRVICFVRELTKLLSDGVIRTDPEQLGEKVLSLYENALTM